MSFFPLEPQHSARQKTVAENLIDGADHEVTPKHLVQNVLSLQDTVRTVLHGKKRVHSVMGPPSTASARRTVRQRHSSISALDVTDILKRTTPRTDVLNFLEQVPQATPVTRCVSHPKEKHLATAQNNSSFTLNEVGVSLLEGHGDVSVNVAGTSDCLMAKTKSINIQLPQVSLTRLPDSLTPKLGTAKVTSASTFLSFEQSSKTALNATRFSHSMELRDTGFQEAFKASIALGQEKLTRESEVEAEESQEEAEEPGGLGSAAPAASSSSRNRASFQISGTVTEIVSANVKENENIKETINTNLENTVERVNVSRKHELRAAAQRASADEENSPGMIEKRSKEALDQKSMSKKDSSSRGSIGTRNLFSALMHIDSGTGEPDAVGRTTTLPSSVTNSSSRSAQSSSAVRRSDRNREQAPQQTNAVDQDLIKKRALASDDDSSTEDRSSSVTQQISPSQTGAQIVASVEPGQSSEMSENQEDYFNTPKPPKRPRTSTSAAERSTATASSYSSYSTALRSRQVDKHSLTVAMSGSSSANMSRRATSSSSGLGTSGHRQQEPTSIISESGSLLSSSPSPLEEEPSDDRAELSEDPLPSEGIQGRSLSSSGFPISSTPHPNAHPPPPSFSPLSTKSGSRLSTSAAAVKSQGRTQEQTQANNSERSLKQRSQTSVVKRLSDHFDKAEKKRYNQREQFKSTNPENSAFVNLAAITSSIRVPSPGPSNSSQDNDINPDYSPLKTPRLPARVSTPPTIQTRSIGRKLVKPQADEASRKLVTPQADKASRRATTVRKSTKKPAKGMSASVVKALFNHFSKLRVAKEAIAEVEKVSDQYWKNLAEDLEAYAHHAHRQVISESDFELLMRRQGLITDKCSLNTLIAKYLPLELRQELIPIARSGNILEPKP